MIDHGDAFCFSPTSFSGLEIGDGSSHHARSRLLPVGALDTPDPRSEPRSHLLEQRGELGTGCAVADPRHIRSRQPSHMAVRCRTTRDHCGLGGSGLVRGSRKDRSSPVWLNAIKHLQGRRGVVLPGGLRRRRFRGRRRPARAGHPRRGISASATRRVGVLRPVPRSETRAVGVGVLEGRAHSCWEVSSGVLTTSRDPRGQSGQRGFAGDHWANTSRRE